MREIGEEKDRDGEDMKQEFRFNSTDQFILTPENKKEEQMIAMFIGGKKGVKIMPPPAASPTSLVLESYDVPTEEETRKKLLSAARNIYPTEKVEST